MTHIAIVDLPIVTSPFPPTYNNIKQQNRGKYGARTLCVSDGLRTGAMGGKCKAGGYAGPEFPDSNLDGMSSADDADVYSNQRRDWFGMSCRYGSDDSD